MCRNIKMLYNFEPPATDEEIRASALAIRPENQRLRRALEGERNRFRARRGAGGPSFPGTA